MLTKLPDLVPNISLNTPMMTELIPLSSLKPGDRGKIAQVGGQGQTRRRYMEMGFVRGEIVLVRRVAPLGDPVEYEVKGYRVSLRKSDADRILVQSIEGAGNA